MTDRILILIPAYNESQAILDQVIGEWLATGGQVCLIDDGSWPPLKMEREDLTVLRHDNNMGQGAALRTGLNYGLTTEADYFLTVDADGQHPTSNLPSLLDPLSKDASDIVFGSRFLNKDHELSIPLFRRLTLKLAVGYNNFITGLSMTDAHNGLRAMNRLAATTISIEENRMAHASEIPLKTCKNKLRWKEVAVQIEYSKYATEKGQSLWQIFPLSWQLLKLKWRNRRTI